MTASDETILILAPRGRDAGVIAQVLVKARMTGVVCADIAALLQGLRAEAGAILLTEEALAGPATPEPLLYWLQNQPAWSDIPVIALVTRAAGRRTAGAAALLERLGNVVLLERPIDAETLISATLSARRVRRRQYQTRTLLAEREASEQRLRDLNETLEQRVEERARELDQTRDTLVFALDSASMGSWELDLRTGAIRRSSQHDRIFGYATPRPEWWHADFIAHVLEPDRAHAALSFAEALKAGRFELQCRICRADGAVRWIALKGRVDYDDSGEPIRLAGIVMDTTESRLTEDALHQAQKMEAIGQLTGGVAHDFNNLLTVIMGGLDMISRRPDLPDRVVRLAEAAMVATRRGEQLTQQLLAFSRRQMLRPVTLDPNHLLRAFAPLAQRAVGEAIGLQLALAADIQPIRVDPAQFEAAILNLIVNARDASPDGAVIVVESRNQALDASTALSHALPPGRYVEVAVRDNGAGIDSDVLARAFEPFFTTKEVGKGSGLGLSQVYGFTLSAGGRAMIVSSPGQGTTVRLLLPRSAEPLDDRHGAAELPPAPAPPAAGETVLLVEDDEQVLGMAIESLRELRYNVIVARNAQQALEHLHGPGRIDVMFSDVVMPGGMNGVQLAVEARRLRLGLRVLLASGYIGGLPAQNGIGADVPMLTKPYLRDELAHQLRKVLAG